MIDTLGLDVDAITQQLNADENKDWLENHVGKAKVIDGERVGGGAPSRRSSLCSRLTGADNRRSNRQPSPAARTITAKRQAHGSQRPPI